ncbi:UDP-N-acetylglucosamine--N-acetylmuramyl-(pentapeptide) pyrophosphoryl-undecaprenol N-acetylglucosamine transferase [Paludibacter propionicigenes WB4]|uniref:UDP-N-acetylglucosamine--N-acetylmuramyl-(pentapeptide) pyrophosphoryl-undecaprenol N-acetylglucosamine transferase n=1 Tax=Paludibacter propionicigenes (strain DSM 17365 / JCM 13257 / WB4) TaxID=694427 RepID=E4T4K1_PALPW|nr:undecaprenyldiphospho-muramoylpentapeptide beta-N-acetylglucosaminyltransferase [Paludibacter propionicigenes]ADQ79645.1 UDP-N-acetylglucosamine--N-acetylmuramyl-(pentapeptide) pyrophosphoryl-undecaprenol N-acetylglucosamine transferase [Paludibacter propionicigenes WB4]
MKYKFIISGGGTGGHIFPAISIANALKKRLPDADILFVGALGRMEMERVPAAGYPIEGLPISGFDRKNMLRNIKVVWNLLRSLVLARRIISRFKPNVAIGVGGYASAPTLRAASALGVPTVIQEQNSYAGVTNKLLAKKAKRICVAYDGMDRFFPKEKVILTGNPVRQDLFSVGSKTEEAYKFFNFDPKKKTILVVGGSLGARTINQSIIAGLDKLAETDVQIIWQTGKFYIEDARKAAEPFISPNLLVTDFVSRMDMAYSIADLVVSRAGASSISELCLLAKPVILIPSPNVAEDHQTQNALALVRKDAAIMIKDTDSKAQLVDKMMEVIEDEAQLNKLSKNILQLAEKDSADRIAEEILKLVAL